MDHGLHQFGGSADWIRWTWDTSIVRGNSDLMTASHGVSQNRAKVTSWAINIVVFWVRWRAYLEQRGMLRAGSTVRKCC